MARRITRKTTRRTARTVTISTFLDLPGAIFYGEISDEDIETARHRQDTREGYEQTGCITALWHELTSEGWPTSAIVDAVLNPASITSCGYVGPGTSLAALPAILAMETAALTRLPF